MRKSILLCLYLFQFLYIALRRNCRHRAVRRRGNDLAQERLGLSSGGEDTEGSNQQLYTGG